MRVAAVGAALAIVSGAAGSGAPAFGVVGGAAVDSSTFASDWSFTVAVVSVEHGNSLCTGTLVEPDVVVTAAHCVDGSPGADMDTVLYGSQDLASASAVGIISTAVHPQWDSTTLEHDSAVLQLAAPLTGVTPIRLALDAEVTGLGTPVPVRFAGYGDTETLNDGDLYAATSTVTHPSTVTRWARESPPLTCFGDSGGPLVATLEGGEPVLIGAASFGDAGCESVSVWTNLGKDTFVQSMVEQPDPPLPELRVLDAQATEGNPVDGTRRTPMRFRVRLTDVAEAPVTVRVATSDGTAKAPADYDAVSTKVTLDPGETVTRVTVPVVRDRRAEPTQRFTVRLSRAGGADIGRRTATGTLLDDD